MQRTETRVWLVSACLLGERCRYDGDTARVESRARLLPIARERLVPACPEQLGGLGTPRPAAWLDGGDGAAVLEGRARVFAEGGRDVTEAFVLGADEALRVAREHGATHACLKARSPSCGIGRVHAAQGLVEGDGVTAARLKTAGLTVLSEESLPRTLERPHGATALDKPLR